MKSVADADVRAKADSIGSFPIVGVGASAGGLEAFTELLHHLPCDTGMAFVLVQHLDPQHESALTQLLSRATAMPVHEAIDKQPVQPNCIYVIAPNTNLSIAHGRLILEPRPTPRAPHRSVDFFFESLAQDQRERAIGVILSGSGTDGSIGLEAIKAEGGITFAQDHTARYDAMPRSAIAAGCVDFVCAPANIAQELAQLARHPYVVGPGAGPGEIDRAAATTHAEDETPLPSGGRGTPRNDAQRARSEAAQPAGGADQSYKKILLLLRTRSGADFSLYKSTTIQRRINRRMILNKQPTPEDYAGFLRGNGKELDALYSDVLISVTSFFRNPEAFEVLGRKVFPQLLAQRGDEPVRTWVLGCSTGQEAYSLAMAFTESADQVPRARKLQVFATDLNDALLDKARHGLYAKSLAQDVSPERLRRFFVEEEGGYRVIKPLRDMVVFARHNLIGDPPFSRMDLISCRNLLIYLEPSLQKKALPTFHYALKPDGFLFLGASESIGGFTELFEPIDKKQKIYSRKTAPTPAFHLPLNTARAGPSGTARKLFPALPHSRGEVDAEGFGGELNAQREADRITINRFAPPGVLINADLQILQFRGTTGDYLQPPSGKASFDVLKMAREGLMLPLRAAINEAKKENRAARKDQVRIAQDGADAERMVSVEVIPLKNLREPCFLVLFEDQKLPPPRQRGRVGEGAGPTGAAPPSPRLLSESQSPARGGRSRSDSAEDESAARRRVAELEADLAETRDFLQSVQEQHEAANEELQASNEEGQSANEELQSVNEELETSKEELESTNEELVTVNEEMSHRNAELSRLNSDLTNVQTSTGLAIVLLGRDLGIRRFSAQAGKLFSLQVSDVGRPFGHVRHTLRFPELESFISEVIAGVRESEREVQDQDGRWFSLRVQPYLTLDNVVDGAVLVLLDIDLLKRSEQAIAEARDYAEAIIRTAPDPLLILNADLRVNTANEAFYETFKVRQSEAEGRLVYELGNGQWNIPKLRELLEDILPQKSVFDKFEVTHSFRTIGSRSMVLNARKLSTADGAVARILLGIQDVTEIRRAHEAARTAGERFSLIAESMPQKLFTAAPNGEVDYFNPQWSEFSGLSLDQIRNSGWKQCVHPDDIAENLREWQQSIDTGAPFHFEGRFRRVDGEYRWHISRAVALKNAAGKTLMWLGSNTDIHDIKEADNRKNEFLAILAHELRNPLAPIRYSLEILQRADRDSELIEPALDSMNRHLGQMTRLIDDLLDVGRISRGKLTLRRRDIKLAAVIEHAVEASRPAMELSRHELTVSLPPQPIILHADPVRLAQVFGNLLTNACKFTPPNGRISLRVEQRGEEVMVSVKDSGVGIASDLLLEIFENFTQVAQSQERSQGGLGIGLSLVRRLVQMHSGSVLAFSDGPGRGSEFVVRLPVSPTPPRPATIIPSLAQPAVVVARRVLVVDDNIDAAESLAILLQMSGHETRTAFDGVEALEAATQFKPDVVLLDIGMPKMNGYDAVRRIRQQPWGEGMVLVALTGWGQDEDRKKTADAGFDHHLVKPVNFDALTQLLAGLPRTS